MADSAGRDGQKPSRAPPESTIRFHRTGKHASTQKHGRRPERRPQPGHQQQPARHRRDGPRLAEIGTVYGGRHGIEGVLKEELLDLSAQAPRKSPCCYTPAAGSIGTCRYKLQAEADRGLRPRDRGLQGPRRRLLPVHRRQRLDGHGQQGGRSWPSERGLDLVGVGVPKTIDNDVGDSEFKLIDHTPGYGSVAKYWMHMVQNANEENAGSSPGRSGAGDAGDGPQDRLHSGRGPAGRSRTARCRCRSIWPKAPARSSRWPTR